MAEIQMGTLYDVNKEAMKKEKRLSSKEVADAIKEKVVKFFSENKRYFMLLCNERKDYTVFKKANLSISQGEENFARDLKECLINRGKVISIDQTEDGVAFEIWLYIDDEAFCYYFFPYDEAVIEV